MLEQDGMHFSERWGYLSRAGLNDKSQFTRQIEKYADIYTSRVSNFLRYTVSDLHNAHLIATDSTQQPRAVSMHTA
jgi:5' nucleotidase family